MKKSLIFGITGQDGSYLAELLLDKGYVVHGVIRRSSSFNTSRIDHLYKDPHIEGTRLFLHYGDVSDALSVGKVISEVLPDEVYNLAAMSHVAVSFSLPEYTARVDAIGTLLILEAVKKYCPKAKIYNATTSELYGKVEEIPQTETTPFHPRSPYGVAKLYSYWIARNYREAYGIFISNGILYNHESPRRKATFVSTKIVKNLVRLWIEGEGLPLYIGNLESKRDWGYSPEYVFGMWKMLQQEEPDDFVLATGETHSVREFIEVVCEELGLALEWTGKRGSLGEVGYSNLVGKNIVLIDKQYFRPSEVDFLLGDATKAKMVLGWEPKVKFKELVRIMVNHEKENYGKE